MIPNWSLPDKDRVMKNDSQREKEMTDQNPRISLWGYFSLTSMNAALFMFTGAVAYAQDATTIEARSFVYANPVAATDVQGYEQTARIFMEQVTEKTDGLITFNVTHGGGLLSHSDMMDGVGGGLADMGSAQLSVDPSAFPLWSLSGIHDPDIGTRLSAWEQTMVTRLLMDVVPELEAELEAANLRMMFSIASPAHNLIMATRIQELDDLNGLQIRTYGQFLPRLFEAVGATPVNVPPDELYTALDRGVVDGAYTQASFLRDIGAHEVTNQWMYVGEGTTPPLNVGYHMTVNNRLWNGLSDALKVIMLEAARDAERHFAKDFIDADLQRAVDFFEEYGLAISHMSDEDISRWSEAAPDMFGELASSLDSQGLPGSRLVEEYLRFTEMSGDEIEALYNDLWERTIASHK